MWGGRSPENGARPRGCNRYPPPGQVRNAHISVDGGRVPKAAELQRLGRARQQFLDFDRDAVAADDDRALRHRHVVGENANLVLLGGIEFYDGAAAKAKNLMDRHRSSAQHHSDVDRDIVQSRQVTSRSVIGGDSARLLFHHGMVTG
jgi:hypothetical protein